LPWSWSRIEPFGRAVLADGPKRHGADQFDMVMHQHAVMEHGDDGGFDQFTLLVEHRRLEEDVEALPLARRS